MSFIELSDVTKEYKLPNGQKIIALENINLNIEKGEFLSLVGSSGAGKSTLIKLLIREDIPSNGKITVADRDITKIKNHEIPYYRRQIGVVFQDFKLLAQKNVEENIAFALEVCEATNIEIKDKVSQILAMVGLVDRAKNYPHELSGGEKQRVAIARAMVGLPQILMADEPTGNLDPVNSQEIINLLIKINKLRNTTVILATHNQEIINYLARRVVTMADGKIVSDEKIGKLINIKNKNSKKLNDINKPN